MAKTPYPHRILYVEDHEDTIEMISLILEGSGFHVTARGSVEAGLKAVEEQSFDLYLLDSWLPDGWGVDLCKKIREFDPHTPIVFYSAAAYERDRELALQSGAQAYLTKPTDSLNLSESLLQLIEDSKNGSNGTGK